MAKSVERKTRLTGKAVDDFIDSQESEQVRDDCRTIARIMEKATGARPEMWGTSIVGFARYRYVAGGGRRAEWFVVGFSPRKQSLTLYVMDGFSEYGHLLDRLGPHKTGKACLYLKRLSDADPDVLRALVERSVEHVRRNDRGPAA